jgi:hypothetical protein
MNIREPKIQKPNQTKSSEDLFGRVKIGLGLAEKSIKNARTSFLLVSLVR